MPKLQDEASRQLHYLQRDECTESAIYEALSKRCKDEENKKLLYRIAMEERAHSKTWEKYTNEKVTPKKWKVFFHQLIALVFGFTFAIKQMEMGEKKSQETYAALISEIPEASLILEEEKKHENALIMLLDENKLHYVGSIVLGLNDALVELTGTLVGLTFALQNNRLVALSGIITGVSATLSMAASEFLSAQSEGRKDALKSSLYTGGAYMITVVLLILPYLLLPIHAYITSLVILLVTVLLVIITFNYYMSVVHELPFFSRFIQMASISFGVSAFSFLVGILAKNLLGLDVS